MKTRSKLLLAAVSLLTVSVAATATSAYAWYTANKQVSANLTSMGVQATSGTLSISHASIGDSFTTEEVKMENDTYDLKASASNKALTDVSSNGDGTFIKPKFNHDYSKIVGEYDQTPKTEGTKIGQKKVKLSDGVGDNPTAIEAYGVISLAITISNSAAQGAGSLDVYIDPKGTTLESKNLASAQDSARFSIIEVGSPNSVYMYCSPTADAETTGYKYLSKNESNEISETTLTDSDLIQDKAETKLFAKSGVVASSSDQTKNKSNGYLCTLDTSTNKSKTFLITMWIEGTDKDCSVAKNTSISSSILVSDLSLNLGLYALEA